MPRPFNNTYVSTPKCHCGMMAVSRGMCKKHYEHFMYFKKKNESNIAKQP